MFLYNNYPGGKTTISSLSTPEFYLKHTSLQRILLWPFVLLVVLLATTIGGLSYRSNEDAADEFSRRVVLDIVTRIKQSTETHLTSPFLALKAIAPPVSGMADPTRTGESFLTLPSDPLRLEERLWIAMSFFPRYGSVYFGAEDGSFLGLSRSPDMAELRVREAGDVQRKAFQMNGPFDRGSLLRSQPYDTTAQLWYTRAVAQGSEIWSPVYTDINTMLPTMTLSKPVLAANGSLKGVIAADLSLQDLKHFFKTINVSKSGVAFIIDRNGAIVAASSEELPVDASSSSARIAEEAGRQSILLHQAYGDIRSMLDSRADLTQPVIQPMEGEDGRVHIGVVKLGPALGLDWTIVAAVPRADFMGNATRGLYQSMAIGLLALAVALIIGLSVLSRVLRDIQKLTTAAQKIERGEPVDSLDITRKDELGLLAQSFIEMETGLRTDRLTGVLNRASLITRIGLRMSNASPDMPLAFALLFIDLDRFKAINDIYGHEAGDRILVHVAHGMRQMLRGQDMVARFGGDEFVVYLHGIESEANLSAVIQKLRAVIVRPIEVQDGVMEAVGASIGAAMYPADGCDVDTLLNLADSRMYDAKKAGRCESVA